MEFIRSKWWETVRVSPEETKIMVFIMGMLKAFSLWIPVGGQINPMSPTGLRAKWKKVQKNLKNSITSLKINSIMPSFSEVWVFRVCEPI